MSSPVPRRVVLGVPASVLLPWQVRAQSLSDRPIRIISPFAPGGGADIFARLLAPEVSARLARGVLVENRSGASGNIGTEAVARAPADGHTVLYTTASITINPSLFPRLPFDPGRDLVGLNLVCAQPHIIVAHPGTGIRTVAELIARARAQPGTLAYGSSGSGTSGHLTMEWLAHRAAAELIHIPYRGAGASQTAMLSGEVQVGVSVGPVLKGHIAEGRLVPIATTGEVRLAMLPDVPTLSEAGFPDLVTDQWHGIFAPSALPEGLRATISGAFSAAIATPAFEVRVAEEGGRVINAGPGAFAAFLRAEGEKWASIVRATGARAD